jgi:excinuclease UvrABC nuclease subunit
VLSSIFDDIEGMGPKRVQKLLQSYDSTKSIANTDLKDISEKTGIPERIAKEVVKKAQSIAK